MKEENLASREQLELARSVYYWFVKGIPMVKGEEIKSIPCHDMESFSNNLNVTINEDDDSTMQKKKNQRILLEG